MEACELIRLILNKVTVPAKPKKAGNPGYGIKTAIRVLVYSRLKGLENDTRIVWHLKRHQQFAQTLGLSSIPDRTTIHRWWIRYQPILEEIMVKLADIIRDIIPTTHLIVDSTPLKDMHDLEAKWGFTCRGPIKGFKLHVAVNQLGLPLRAIVTQGNRFDSIFLPKLIEDLEAQYVLADAGYHSLDNLEAVKAIGAVPIIAVNPRRKGKEGKVSNAQFFGGRRQPVEQFNGHGKDNVLRGCWVRLRGLVKKASMVMAALISINSGAIWALLEGSGGLKEASRYWD
ncbi:MAG: transposase [Chloroflexi bacterium]|nr:transposase [Chloroflexota bacterium]